MSLSIVRCATEGFQVARRSPGAIVVWGLYLFLAFIVFGAIVFLFAGSTIMEMVRNPSQFAGQGGDPRFVLGLLGRLGLGYLFGTIALIFMMAVLLGAMFRAVLMPQDKGFAYLQIGGREVKLAVSMLLIGLLFFVIFIVLGAVLGMTGMMGHYQPGQGVPAGVWLMYLVTFLIWVGFSMSYPASFMNNSVHVFEGWKIALRAYPQLVLMYLLLFVICFVMALVVGLVLGVLFAFTGGAAMISMSQAGAHGMPALGPAFIGVALVCFVLYMIFASFMSTLIYGAQAAAYRDLAGTDEAKVF
jgi:hypothetical protein